MKRLRMLLALALLIATAVPAAADERVIARLNYGMARDYRSLGRYEVGKDDFGKPLMGDCVVGIFGPVSTQWQVQHPPTNGPYVIPVYQIDNPPVTQPAYALTGQVWYDALDKPAYLEMWSEFPGGGRYFSRTLADSGPTMQFEGTSAPRLFRLPFTATPGQTPRRITINLVVAGTGKIGLTDVAVVEETPTTRPAGSDPSALPAETVPPVDGGVPLSNLPPGMAVVVRNKLLGDLAELIDARRTYADSADEAARKYGDNSPPAIDRRGKLAACDTRIASLRQSIDAVSKAADAPVAAAGPDGVAGRALKWAGEHFAVLFGGLIVLCGVAGIVMRRLTLRGQGRALVLGVFGLMLAGGVAQVFAAGIALGIGRPASAWGTLLACAAILIVVPALSLPQVRRRYADIEMRKMRAMDVPA